jgi:hypothetical protein
LGQKDLKGGCDMQNMFDSTCKEGYIGDFSCRVLNQFTRWGVDISYILNMLEMSRNENELLDVLEDCLVEFGKFAIDTEDYPWYHTSINYNSYIQDIPFTLECRSLLDELDEIRCESLTNE